MNVFVGAFLDVLKEADRLLGIDLVVVENKPSYQQVLEYSLKNKKRLKDCAPVEEIGARLFAGTDLLIVASFGRILQDDIIKNAGLILNFHPGVIQKCRGRHPLPCAILSKHSMMGMTCHIIDSKKIDAGPIVAQLQLPINYSKNYRYNEERLRRTLPDLTRNVLKEYLVLGEVTNTAWLPAPESYFKPLPKKTLEHVFRVQRLKDIFSGETA
jgi:methionyl-tRNA formyltransferase